MIVIDKYFNRSATIYLLPRKIFPLILLDKPNNEKPIHNATCDDKIVSVNCGNKIIVIYSSTNKHVTVKKAQRTYP